MAHSSHALHTDSLRIHGSFTIDTAGASTEGIAVEIDPPLLPRIRRRRKTPARSSSPSLSDQSADEDGTRSAFGGEGDEDEDTDDDEAVSGPFPAAEHVVIRWAAPNAGLLIAQRADLSAAHEGAGMLRVEGFDSRLQVALADKLALAKARKKISDSDILLDVEWTCSVRGAHYPGLDQEACLQ